MKIRSLSDTALRDGLKENVDRERLGTLGVVEHLAEVEERKLHLIEGYGSLYSFVVVELGYSESAAMRRITAARCVRRFPRVLAMLRKGLLNLSTISFIAPVLMECLEDQKFDQIKFLKRVAGQSSRRVKEIVTEYQPAEVSDVQESFSPYLLHLKEKAAEEKMKKLSKHEFENYLRREGEVYEKRYRVQFGASADLVKKLEYAKQLLSGKYPQGASTGDIFEEMLDEFIARKCPKEKAERARAGKEKETPAGSRYIPASVKWEVLKRDGFQCTFIGASGKRCESCWDLELDHYPVPFARGGESKVENLRALCSAHNQLAAEQEYGREFMREMVA